MESDPEKKASIGMPTWLYGLEPPIVIASVMAGYFASSAREEDLLTIAGNGLILAPGGAGTIQEIFQDAAQNFSFGEPAPYFRRGLLDVTQARLPASCTASRGPRVL
jgi:hypothetical protein